MNIVLNIEDKQKNFGLKTVTGSLYRRFLEIQKVLTELEEKQLPFEIEHFDMMVAFLVQAFGNRFTEEELLDGLGADQIQLKFMEVAKDVNSRTQAGMISLIEKKKQMSMTIVMIFRNMGVSKWQEQT